MRKAGVFCWGALIGTLGGLIGLGGAEFRLPVLVSIYKFRTLQAIVINLIVSLVTVIFSFIFRAGLVSLNHSHVPVVLDILCGSLIGSYIGVRFATRISESLLTRIVAVFLVALSLVLIAHDFIFHARSLAIPFTLKLVLGTLAGVMIGIFSSMLGVAGGELIIPTIILLFAVDIKLAGSLSLAIGIPTIIMGIVKYQRQGRLNGLPMAFILWMSLGSIGGALLGSYLLSYVRGSVLQTLLGLILLISAAKLWRAHSKRLISN
ncbi:MAG TPA: sulfite exporter TauE/SafE family protein [Pyrinomonadaceae bacterium]|nr:sulfite exporter TauE/SafE family protein [Pyrinomonadaceae bacterium]